MGRDSSETGRDNGRAARNHPEDWRATGLYAGIRDASCAFLPERTVCTVVWLKRMGFDLPGREDASTGAMGAGEHCWGMNEMNWRRGWEIYFAFKPKFNDIEQYVLSQCTGLLRSMKSGGKVTFNNGNIKNI